MLIIRYASLRGVQTRTTIELSRNPTVMYLFLAVVAAVVLDSQSRACQYLRGACHVESSGLEGRGALGLVELDPHDSCYYKK